MDTTVMFNLQAAAVTAAVTASAGAELTAGIPEDGISFSDVLAKTTGGMGQAENTASTEDTNVDESGVVSEDTEVQTGNDVDEVTEDAKIPSTAFEVELDDIAKLIEQSQDGVKKGLRMLLKAVVKAICGNNDGRERKTDLFSVLGGNSMGSFDDSDSDMLFIGAEIMNRISIAVEFGLNQEDTDTDDIIMGLDKLVKKIFSDSEDDDEIDESTAAEIVSALLNIHVHDDVTFAPEAEKVEAVENAVTALKAPKEELREVQPEKIPEAEHKVDEFKAEIKSLKYEPKAKPEVSIQDTVNDARSFMQMNSATARINDAGAQIRALSGETSDEEGVAGLAEEKPADVEAESASIAAAVNAEPHVVRIENSPEIKIEAEDDLTARSVEDQITEAITEKSLEIKDDNGTEELIMVLKPENLGQVAVKLVKENGAISVMLSAQYDEVGKMMTERAASLGSSLSNNNVEVKSVEVVNPSNAAEQMGLAFTNQGFSFAQNFNRGQEYSPERRGGYDDLDEIEGVDVIDATDNIKLIREARLWTTA